MGREVVIAVTGGTLDFARVGGSPTASSTGLAQAGACQGRRLGAKQFEILLSMYGKTSGRN
jgi:hypothetical protein